VKDTAFPDRMFTPCTLAEKSPDSSDRSRLRQEHWNSAFNQGYKCQQSRAGVLVKDSLANLEYWHIGAVLCNQDHWSSAVKFYI